MCLYSLGHSPEVILPLLPREGSQRPHRKEALTSEKGLRHERKWKPFCSGRKREGRHAQWRQMPGTWVHPSPHLGSEVKMGEENREKSHLQIKSLKQKKMCSLLGVLWKTASQSPLTPEERSPGISRRRAVGACPSPSLCEMQSARLR